MKHEEEFKSKLNDLIHSKAFPFDENNWEEAQKLMGGTNAAPKFLNKYVVLIIAGILSLASTFAYFVSKKGQTEKMREVKGNITTSITTKTNIRINDESNSNDAVIKNTEINSKNLNSAGERSRTPKLMTKTENLGEIKSSDLISNVKRSKPTINLVKTKPSLIVENFSSINSKKGTLVLSTYKKILKNENGEPEQAIYKQDDVAKHKLNISLDLKQNAIIKVMHAEKSKSLDSSVILSERNYVAFQSDANAENKILKIDNVIENKTNVYSQNNHSQALIIAPSINSNDSSDDKIRKSDNTNTSEPHDYSMNNLDELKSNNISILPKVLDSNQIEKLKNDSDNINKNNFHVDSVINNIKLVVQPEIKHVFSFELGTSYLFGWKDNQGRDAKGFNPIGGINYTYNFNPKFSFLTGVLYTSVGNINNADFTSKRVKYNFGEEIDYTTISAKNMYYLTIPIKFLYRYKIKSKFGLGLNAAYLMDVTSNVATYNKRFNTLSQPVVSKSDGYKGGFKKFDLQFSLFYRRKLIEKLAIHTEINLGLLDIKNDKYFKPAQFEGNSGFRLTLVYDIFNK